MRVTIAGLISFVLIVVGVAVSSAQNPSSGYTTRGYRYDASTCGAGFQACMTTYLKTGWQNAAASSYCSQACGVFHPRQAFDRHSGGNW
jgi:hypothetical protein